jgi:hypothetical protein
MVAMGVQQFLERVPVIYGNTFMPVKGTTKCAFFIPIPSLLQYIRSCNKIFGEAKESKDNTVKKYFMFLVLING